MADVNRIKQLLDIEADPKGAILGIQDKQEDLKKQTESNTISVKNNSQKTQENANNIITLFNEVEDVDFRVVSLNEGYDDTIKAISRLDMDIQTLTGAIESIEIPDIPQVIHGEDGYTPIKGVDYFDGLDADETKVIEEVLQKIEVPQALPPDHEWKGSFLRFKRPDGTWGEWINLMGQPGKSGSAGRSVRISDNGVVQSVQAKELDFLDGFTIAKRADDDIFSVSVDTDYFDGLFLTEAEGDARYLQILNNLSDIDNVGTARTNLGLVAGGSGDIWVEKAGDTMTGDLIMASDISVNFGSSAELSWDTSDPNANLAMFDLPTNNGTDVPGFVLGTGIKGQDLGFFNGLDDAFLGVVSSARDAYGYMSHTSATNYLDFYSSKDMQFTMLGNLGGSGILSYRMDPSIAKDLRVLFRTSDPNGFTSFEFGTTASLFYLRTDAGIDSNGMFVTNFTGRQIVVADGNNRARDSDIVPQNDPCMAWKSVLNHDTDNGETLLVNYTGFYAGEIDNADPTLATREMETDRPTFDMNIWAVNANSAAVTNVTGGNLVLKAGNGVTATDDGRVQIPEHHLEIQGHDVISYIYSMS